MLMHVNLRTRLKEGEVKGEYVAPAPVCVDVHAVHNYNI